MARPVLDPAREAATERPGRTSRAARWRQSRAWHRLALVLTLGLIAVVVISLPFALESMRTQLFGTQTGASYDLVSGHALTPADAAATLSQSFVTISIADIDEGTQVASLSIAANRTCPSTCPTLDLTLFAVANTAAVRRGLPPSVTVTLRPIDELFLQTVQLPIRGQPSLYPFDTWQLWLGLTIMDVRPDGTRVPLTVAQMPSRATFTLQSLLPDFVMAPPTPIAPEQVAAVHDPLPFAAVQGLAFTRPAYLKDLTVILVVLITVSGLLALFTRGINELVLGVGGLILGIWGVRSILVPQPVPTITAIDLALSTVILLLLLGLAVRAARYFYDRSAWPWSRPHA
jgi:hypothetical protein